MSLSNPSPFPAPNATTSERLDEARKIEVRPRAGAPGKLAEGGEVSDVMLSFSCPSCLEMLAAPKTSAQSSVQCPACGAVVMPPKIVSVAGSAAMGGKTMLPPPRKTGTQALRQ